jgi:hypothetical protein
MTNFNRRTLMSLAGIAAAEPAMSLLGSAETRTSALPEVQTGNGEWIVDERIGCPVYLIEFEINGRAKYSL